MSQSNNQPKKFKHWICKTSTDINTLKSEPHPSIGLLLGTQRQIYNNPHILLHILGVAPTPMEWFCILCAHNRIKVVEGCEICYMRQYLKLNLHLARGTAHLQLVHQLCMLSLATGQGCQVLQPQLHLF